MRKPPRVLVFGQPFNNFSGGGITLSNLFTGWPKGSIASLWAPWDNSEVTTDVCQIFYRIGSKERRWSFPFSLFKQPFPSSGCGVHTAKEKSPISTKGAGIKYWLSIKIINPFLQWLGLYHESSSIELSQELQCWLGEFKPDVLYFQVSTLEGIKFAGQLIDYLQIPSVIHMMDDWPSTISFTGPLKNYWNKMIDCYFRNLLDKVDLFLSISDAMSEEYLKRYMKSFTAFHNPVDVSKFSSLYKKKDSQDHVFRILYLGRIGTANLTSIIFFANVVSQMKSTLRQFEFHVYTKDYSRSEIDQLNELTGITIHPPVSHEIVPALLTESDLLLLPLDFNKVGLKFARLSIPTKASEYMLSGTPVLVLAPAETAVYKFFRKHNCGFCIDRCSFEEIENGLLFLITNTDYMERISSNAVRIAREEFDAITVRSRFQALISNLYI